MRGIRVTDYTCYPTAMRSLEDSAESEVLAYEIEPDEPLCNAVVTAVGEATDRKIVGDGVADNWGTGEALDPLYDVVDPDALESLFASEKPRREGDVSVSFSYHDCRVIVHSYGIIRIRERDA